MNVETLIYAYLAVCTSMILFNCACIFVFRRKSINLEKRSYSFEREVARQLERLEQGEDTEEEHKEFLKRKLGKIRHLLAFDETLARLGEQKPEQVDAYCSQIHSVFLFLAVENPYRTPMKLTYFAYIIGKYKLIQNRPVDLIMEVLMRLLEEPSLYCRENAMYAVYSSGDVKSVCRALKILDEGRYFHHAKLLTDGLLTFAGDPDALAEALWEEFPQFSVRMQVVILDFMRFGGRDRSKELLSLLADGRQDDEIRFSCIRYFGKYPYEPAFPILIDLAENRERLRWEYTAIAAAALAAYPCGRSIEVLKEKLNSSNWYVRYNAAKSLEGFSLPYIELSDIFDGNDRYAREILQYRLDMKNGKARQEGQTV